MTAPAPSAPMSQLYALAVPWKVSLASSGRLTSNSKVKVPTAAIMSSGRAMAGTLAAYRSPARSCPAARWTGGTGCNWRPSSSSSEAITNTKLTALPMKHQPRPTVLTSTAAIAGPMTRATLTVVLFRVTALRIRSRPTTSATKACRAGLSAALKVPKASARTTTCPWLTFPLSTRMPSARETRPSPAWVTSRMRRLGNLPAGPRTATAAAPARTGRPW
jgi:hypothetical protein